jgi:uncharacterized membrane protein
MKKIVAVVIAVLLVTALFASCSAKSTGTAYSDADGKYGRAESMPQAAASAAASSAAPAMPAPEYKSTVDSNSGGDAAAVPSGGSLTSGIIGSTIAGDKIIYNFSAQIETTKYDDSLKTLSMLLGKYGAFVESSYLSGNSYGNTTFRTADYTIRVPVNNFKGMTDSLALLGNVYNANTTSQNITAQFIDTQSRLDAYRTEERSLLAMLEKAATVADMIAIESRLSDIRYQIESLTSTLQNWQNQVDFSTVSLHISEVAELTEQKPVQRTYWEKMWDGVQATLSGIGAFFKGLFMGIVVALPILAILAVIAVVVLIIVKAAGRKKRARINGSNDKRE